MIIGIGIDAVEIARFAKWHTKSLSSLRRIFSDEEIAYCLQNVAQSAERFAVRFAAREAVYKVLSNNMQNGTNRIPFLTLSAAITIHKNRLGAPLILFNYRQLAPFNIDHLLKASWHVSLTHTKTTALAYVIAEKQV